MSNPVVANTEHARPMKPRRPFVLSAAVIAVCLAAITCQLIGLRSLLVFQGERQAWNESESQRQEASQALHKRLDQLRLDMSASERDLQQTRAELAAAQTDRDRIAAEGAKALKELELTRKSLADALLSQQNAIQQSQSAMGIREAAESRNSELATRYEKLKEQTTTLQAEGDRVDKALSDKKNELIKATADLTTAQRQLSELETQATSTQSKLTDLQSKLVKTSADLESATVELNKAVRKREEAANDAASMDHRLANAQKQEASLSTGNVDLEKLNRDLTARKLELEKRIVELTRQSTELAKEASDKTSELSSLQQRIERGLYEEQKLNATLRTIAATTRKASTLPATLPSTKATPE